MNRWQKEVQQSLLDSEAEAVKALEKQYKAALKDINEKIKLFDSNLMVLDEALATATDPEEIKWIQSMQRSKVYQKQYQEALKGQVSGILDKMHSDQYSTIDSYLHNCYETSYVGTMYDVAKQGIPIIQPINQAAVTKAILTDSKVKGGYYKALGVNVDNLKKVITHEISRGIASGLRYGEIARNIDNAAKTGFYNAYRIARTEGHRIQQSAAYDAQTAIKDKGIDILRQWDAVLDGRTRPSHRKLDGQIVGVDEDFAIDGKKVRKPGDFGRPEEDINCRCIVTTRIPEDLDEEELETLKQRAEFFGLDKTKDLEDFKEKYLEVSKMAAESENKNDWSATKPRLFTDDEKADVLEYAQSKGVEIGSLKAFDGDPELLKSEIKVISEASKEYGIKKPIVLSVESLDDADFAQSHENRISINTKALRNRTQTEQNMINIPGKFSERTVEDIARHEIGHVFSFEHGNIGLEIAQEAYYNTFGENIKNTDLMKFLASNISTYSVDIKETKTSNPRYLNKRKCVEVIPEITVCNYNNPTDFTLEFVRLLKERI